MTTPQPVQRTPEEWKQTLSPEQYQVARCGGTERAFTGAYWNNKATGTYHCICCDAPLFSSKTKFDSGTGWPSFWDGFQPGDHHHSGPRPRHGAGGNQVRQLRCPSRPRVSHGPVPTGQRYCVNSASLDFKAS